MAPQKKKRSSATGRKSSRAARRPAPVRRVAAPTKKPTPTKKTTKTRPTRPTKKTTKTRPTRPTASTKPTKKKSPAKRPKKSPAKPTRKLKARDVAKVVVKSLKKGDAVTFTTPKGVVTVGGPTPRARPRGANGQFVSRARPRPRPRGANGQFVSSAPAVASVPESRVYEEALTLAAGSFPESRFFNSANSLLGYIEGRPGVKGLLAVFPAQAGAPAAAWTPERRQEVRERLEASPPAQEKRDDTSGAGPSYAAWMERIEETLEWADDGGALVEVEVESDSGGDS